MKTLTGLVIGAFALTAVSATSPVLADGHGNKLMKEVEMKVGNKEHAAIITKRRMAMRELSGSMKKIAGYMKKNEGGPADVKAAAMKIEEIGKAIPGLFPAGTGMAAYEVVTGAKPAIFSDAAGFKKIAMTMSSLAADLAKAAGDGASKGDLGAKFGMVGKQGCGGCHRTYREKLKK
ncbi:MAG: c-type cytochrome [Alphaproteobacteria bacterium]